MAEFLTTTGTSSALENIIKGARETLILVSPYLQISQTLLQRLRDTERRGLTIVLVYGKDELRQDQMEQLSLMPNLELYFLGNLHAKCYMNESSLVITSMNMYEYSETKNREMGVLITSDEEAYTKAKEEVESLIHAATRIRTAAPKSAVLRGLSAMTSTLFGQAPQVQAHSRPVRSSEPPPRKALAASGGNKGFCIRCSKDIGHNPDKPLCRSCFTVWAAYENPDYPENCCHHCGREAEVTLGRPLCRACYRTTHHV